MQIVWFKRDLRVFDNEVLYKAYNIGPIIPLYIFEEELWKNSALSFKHYTFLKQSLIDLDKNLEQLGQKLIIEKGKSIEIFNKYKLNYRVKTVWSHEETWNNWVINRNKQLSKWFISNNIEWIELPQNGVVRNLKSRNGWAQNWNLRMRKSLFNKPTNLKQIINKRTIFPSFSELGLKSETNKNFIIGGRGEGVKLLKTFLNKTSENYSLQMSSPSTALLSCSKLSSHISFGTLSIKEIFQSANQRIELLNSRSHVNNKTWIRSIRSFLRRLYWHCHFIQKLEDDPSIEYKNMHILYDSIRMNSFNENFFDAWKLGLTGFPFLDACMRSLKTIGWINFRMRAMLMSFASYHLWLHWKDTSEFLASLFIDFEPGIHYSQSQMQSGTTGINSIRIYNPIKQGKEYDPDGLFIKKWVPELSNLSKNYIHTPWQSDVKLKNYPLPIVDEKQARVEAARKVYSVRKSKKFFTIAKNIYLKHGSRKSEFNNKKKNNNGQIQLNLFQ